MKKVKSVVIVGGGSAGWMTAAHLNRMLLDVTVTLIESPKLPPIGVGEATTPMIVNFLANLGFTSPDSWMPECKATIKTGILFENWYEKGDRYWHPFETLDYVDAHVHVGHSWLKRHADEQGNYKNRYSFYEHYFCSTTLNVAQNKMPHHPDIAYHFDAALFGRLLRSVSREVKYIPDEVQDVLFDEQGYISGLVTANNGVLEADLFVDCTGFRRQIIGRVAPDQPFISYADSLFNDRAVVSRMFWDPDVSMEKQLFPYVKASAQSAGWIWSIPLFDRLSCGYVYSSNFISDDEAAAELQRYAGKGWDRSATNFRVKFQTGKLQNLWVKNCVAVGLAGGFVEPLESSGLAITQLGIELMTSMLDARYYDDHIIKRYNADLDKFYSDIIHFITAHFCFTNREDTAYWAAVKHKTYIMPELEARLEVFKKHLPTLGTKGLRESVWAFRDLSWFCVLLGMNFKFDVPEIGNRALDDASRVVREKRQQTKEFSARLANHYRYLEQQVYRRSAPQGAPTSRK